MEPRKGCRICMRDLPPGARNSGDFFGRRAHHPPGSSSGNPTTKKPKLHRDRLSLPISLNLQTQLQQPLTITFVPVKLNLIKKTFGHVKKCGSLHRTPARPRLRAPIDALLTWKLWAGPVFPARSTTPSSRLTG